MSGALDGRTALVTGAGSGIGAAIAEAFAREGAAVCLVDRRRDAALREVAQRCETLGGRVLTVQGDVSVEADVVKFFRTAESALGNVDVLVNNAGILTECRVRDMPVALFDEMITVDLRSVFLCCRTHHQHRVTTWSEGRGRARALQRRQGRRHRLHPGTSPRGRS